MQNLEFGEKKSETHTRGYSHIKSTGVLIIPFRDGQLEK